MYATELNVRRNYVGHYGAYFREYPTEFRMPIYFTRPI